MASCVECRFRRRLRVELAAASRAVQDLLARERSEGQVRLRELLGEISGSVRGVMERDSSANSTVELQLDPDYKLRTSNVDEFAGRHFPLCMRRMHKALRQDHKLKHDGRLQYIVFMQAAGIPLGDMARFWKQEFVHVMTPQEYAAKRYEYSVRHIYGQEGQRKKLRPFCCEDIITHRSNAKQGMCRVEREDLPERLPCTLTAVLHRMH